jgi:hypothetical protein
MQQTVPDILGGSIIIRLMSETFFFFLVAPTRGSVLPLRSIGLRFTQFHNQDGR